MRARGAWALLALLALTIERSAAAQEDDIDFIPSAIRDEPAPPPIAAAPAPKPGPAFHSKLFLEDAVTLPSARQATPVAFPSHLYGWQNRTSFDARGKWEPSKELTVTLSDRLNVIAEQGQAFASWQTVRNDLREAYVTWEPIPNTYFEGGRINLRSGAALGFNPTDFFKTRSLLGQASLDPSVLRQNRLGTLVARTQTLWSGGSASVAFAPKLADPPDLVAADRNGLDPRFDATNAAYRVLCTLDFDIGDLNAEALSYFEQHRSKLGINLTHPIGKAIVAYAEWAGGPETNLITRAQAYGKETGTLPAALPPLLPTEPSMAFRNDASTGLSWTIHSAMTLNAEYHFHQAGFTERDWRNWFNVGRGPSFVGSALWYVRRYAIDQQEPTAQHQVFVRAAWPKAFVKELELGGFAFVDLLDRSVLTQISVSYFASDAWTFSAYGAANIGESTTERGSLPQRFSTIFSVVRYL